MRSPEAFLNDFISCTLSRALWTWSHSSSFDIHSFLRPRDMDDFLFTLFCCTSIFWIDLPNNLGGGRVVRAEKLPELHIHKSKLENQSLNRGGVRCTLEHHVDNLASVDEEAPRAKNTHHAKATDLWEQPGKWWNFQTTH